MLSDQGLALSVYAGRPFPSWDAAAPKAQPQPSCATGVRTAGTEEEVRPKVPVHLALEQRLSTAVSDSRHSKGQN